MNECFIIRVLLGDAIISSIFDEKRLVIKAVSKNIDKFSSLYKKYNAKILDSISRYPQYAEDIIKLSDEFGSSFVNEVAAASSNTIDSTINNQFLESYRIQLLKTSDSKINKVCIAYDKNSPTKRGISVNGTYFENSRLLATEEISVEAESILNKLYKKHYGNVNITDYTDYYALSMTEEYIDMLPDKYFSDRGISKANVKHQMKKLTDAIERTKMAAEESGHFNDFGNPSFESDWNVENCAEIWSVRQAIMNGAEWENVSIRCIDAKNGTYKSPCYNCQKTFMQLINRSEQK